MSNEDWTGGVSVGVAKMSELENLAVATSKVLPRYITGKQNFDLSGVSVMIAALISNIIMI